jgi:hypothetical protein
MLKFSFSKLGKKRSRKVTGKCLSHKKESIDHYLQGGQQGGDPRLSASGGPGWPAGEPCHSPVGRQRKFIALDG